MRAAVLQLARARTANESRQVLRAAIRQLERAEMYFAAVESMDLADRDARRSIERLKAETVAVRRYLTERRARL